MQVSVKFTDKIHISCIPALLEWLDKHQHIDPSTQTRIILVDSKTGNNYKISVAFLVFVVSHRFPIPQSRTLNSVSFTARGRN
jgi:hypothetical protein